MTLDDIREAAIASVAMQDEDGFVHCWISPKSWKGITESCSAGLGWSDVKGFPREECPDFLFGYYANAKIFVSESVPDGIVKVHGFHQDDFTRMETVSLFKEAESA